MKSLFSPEPGRATAPQMSANNYSVKSAGAIFRATTTFFRTLEQELPQHNLDGVVAFNRIPSADVYFAADPCYLERVKNNSFFYKLKLRHRYYKALEKTVFTAPTPPDT